MNIGSTPLMGPRFREAVMYAAELHETQKRKGSDIPYVGHLLIVAGTVIDWGGDEDMAIAAVLHDAIEDQSVKQPRPVIKERFGERVADFVEALTDADVEPKPPWLNRKKAYFERLRSEKSDEIVLISLADKLHNARAILSDYLEKGESFWSIFTVKDQGAMAQLWYLKSLLEIYEERLPESRTWELRSVLEHLAAETGIGWHEIVEPPEATS